MCNEGDSVYRSGGKYSIWSASFIKEWIYLSEVKKKFKKDIIQTCCVDKQKQHVVINGNIKTT